jgi:alpha-ketoglutarate-dependent taurine dioxygenase
LALRGNGFIKDTFGVTDKVIKTPLMFKYNKVWHQDLVGTKNKLPTVVSSMYMLETPTKGGSTIFASLEKGYQNVASSGNLLKVFQLKACYSAKHALSAEFDRNGFNRIDKYWKYNMDHINDLKSNIVVQPLVTYPDDSSSRRSLMLSPNKLYCFLGYSPRKSQEIMRNLLEKYVLLDDNIGEVHYDKNDLIIFNNRKVMHTSTPTHEVEGNRIYSLLFLDTKEKLKRIS